MQAANRKVAAPPSAFSRGPRRCRRQCAMSFGWRLGDHRCRRRGNGAAFSHGLAGRYTGAPGSVRERTGARISPRVGSREADTLTIRTSLTAARAAPHGGEMRGMQQSLVDHVQRGDWCWAGGSPRTSEAQIRGHMMRGRASPRLAPLARPGRRKKRTATGLVLAAASPHTLRRPGPGSSPGQACEPGSTRLASSLGDCG